MQINHNYTNFVVQTSSAKMPNSIKATYRNVAVLELEGDYHVAAMISTHAKGVLRIVDFTGPCFVGKTERCAYEVALQEAHALVAKLEAAQVRVS